MRGHLICRRCGAIKVLCALTRPIAHWFCHRDDDGRRCGTFNTGDKA